MIARNSFGSSSFELLDDNENVVAAGAPGSTGLLQSSTATLDLANSSFQGTGPEGPSVTVNFVLSFKPAAARGNAAQPYQSQLLASDVLQGVQGPDAIGRSSGSVIEMLGLAAAMIRPIADPLPEKESCKTRPSADPFTMKFRDSSEFQRSRKNEADSGWGVVKLSFSNPITIPEASFIKITSSPVSSEMHSWLGSCSIHKQITLASKMSVGQIAPAHE